MVQSGKFRKRKKILKNIYTEIYFANFPFIGTDVNFEKVTNGRTLVKSRFNVRIVQRHLLIDQDCRHIWPFIQECFIGSLLRRRDWSPICPLEYYFFSSNSRLPISLMEKISAVLVLFFISSILIRFQESCSLDGWESQLEMGNGRHSV